MSLSEHDLNTIEARALSHGDQTVVPMLCAEVRRLRAVYDAGRALFRLKDTGSSDDLYRAWRELGAQLAFADGQIPLGSDADLGRTRGER